MFGGKSWLFEKGISQSVIGPRVSWIFTIKTDLWHIVFLQPVHIQSCSYVSFFGLEWIGYITFTDDRLRPCTFSFFRNGLGGFQTLWLVLTNLPLPTFILVFVFPFLQLFILFLHIHYSLVSTFCLFRGAVFSACVLM